MAVFAPWQLGDIDPSTMRFDPAGYFKRLGQGLGLGVPSEDAEPSAPQGLTVSPITAPGAPQGLTATPQAVPSAPRHLSVEAGFAPTSPLTNPGGYLAELMNQSTTSQAERELSLDEALGKQITDPIKNKTKELDKAEGDKDGQGIVPPQLQETLKEAKIKDPDMSMMLKLIPQGINPITNPKKFLAYFDATRKA